LTAPATALVTVRKRPFSFEFRIFYASAGFDANIYRVECSFLGALWGHLAAETSVIPRNGFRSGANLCKSQRKYEFRHLD